MGAGSGVAGWRGADSSRRSSSGRPATQSIDVSESGRWSCRVVVVPCAGWSWRGTVPGTPMTLVGTSDSSYLRNKCELLPFLGLVVSRVMLNEPLPAEHGYRRGCWRAGPPEGRARIFEHDSLRAARVNVHRLLEPRVGARGGGGGGARPGRDERRGGASLRDAWNGLQAEVRRERRRRLPRRPGRRRRSAAPAAARAAARAGRGPSAH